MNPPPTLPRPTSRAAPLWSPKWLRRVVMLFAPLMPGRLDPSGFAFVMATGIVATAARLRHLTWLAAVLVDAAVLAYVVLVGLTVLRLLYHRAAMVADLRTPARSFGFFTFVAATDVLGSCLATAGHAGAAEVLLLLGASVWLVLSYAVPAAVITSPYRPALKSATGGWFLWVVASESVAVLASGLEHTAGSGRVELAILAVFTWAVGLVLYPGTAVLLALRLTSHRPSPQELLPNYWISMGALAITVFAGARIVEMSDTPIVRATRPLIAGMAVVLWSFASWLVPPLVGAGLWRHGARHVPLRFEAGWWSIVFPLGMYSVAGMYLSDADRLPLVGKVGSLWFWVALTAWLLSCLGMLTQDPPPAPEDMRPTC